MTFRHDLTILTEDAIPPDVLVEHIAVCLRSLNFTGKVGITVTGTSSFEDKDIKVEKAHPFDDPNNVMFDDTPQLEEFFAPKPPSTGTVNEGSFDAAYPQGEGFAKTGFSYPPDSIMGAVDPYPNVTRALDALRNRDKGE